jgi:hypothetical protein
MFIKCNPSLEQDSSILLELQADFNYVNLIGYKNNFPGTNNPVWQFTKQEINENLSKLKKIIEDPKKSAKERYLAKLQTLALLRESMYPAKSKIPNSIQMINVILQAKYHGNND